MKRLALIGLLIAVAALLTIFVASRPSPDTAPVSANETVETATTVPADDDPARAAAAQDTADDAVAEQTAPPGFCARDFSDVEARAADVEALQEAGGLVHIFEREARLEDPYGCADYYLARGLDVSAVDARSDTPPLTGLFYAIQRNDPKMVRFMLEHGADPRRRAGENDIRATGYAYSLAMQDQRINRNEVIAILDEALLQRQRSGN